MQERFHDVLKDKMDDFVHCVYKLSKGFPKDELYASTSQLRRASLSVILNYIEGFARRKAKVNVNFLEISYGSLQESKYLLDFAFKEKYISKPDYDKVLVLADEIGAMLWRTIEHKSRNM